MELPLAEFLPIAYNAMTDEDLAGIIRICKLNPLGWGPSEVLQRIASHHLSFWRLSEEKADIRLVLEIRVHPHGNELLIWGIFGRGLFAHIDRAVDFCKLIANKYFCQRVVGEVYSKGLGKLYEKIGAKQVFTRYSLEA